jgi:hypothetical protein
VGESVTRRPPSPGSGRILSTRPRREMERIGMIACSIEAVPSMARENSLKALARPYLKISRLERPITSTMVTTRRAPPESSRTIGCPSWKPRGWRGSSSIAMLSAYR